MEKKIDAEKTLTLLATLWAEQHRQKITDIKITRRGSNEEVNNSADNSVNSI